MEIYHETLLQEAASNKKNVAGPEVQRKFPPPPKRTGNCFTFLMLAARDATTLAEELWENDGTYVKNGRGEGQLGRHLMKLTQEDEVRASRSRVNGRLRASKVSHWEPGQTNRNA